MPRVARVVVPGVPHHVTQRGNNRRDVFFSDDGRAFYLETLARLCAHYSLVVHGYCLMTNHVHLIVTPATAASLAKGIGLAHQLYAQYVNDLHGWVGHLWRSRFYSCSMDDEHYLAGMGYVERNPQRAGLVRLPWEYPWSSAAAHCNGVDPAGLVSFRYWQRFANPALWREILCGPDDPQLLESIREKTRHGRPLGSDRFIDELEEKLGRPLRPRRRGRPRKSVGGPVGDGETENR